MKKGDRVKIKNTVFELLESRKKLNGTVNSVFTRCKVIESANPYYFTGKICEMNLDFAQRL